MFEGLPVSLSVPQQASERPEASVFSPDLHHCLSEPLGPRYFCEEQQSLAFEFEVVVEVGIGVEVEVVVVAALSLQRQTLGGV